MTLLPKRFYSRDSLDVARDLLGKHIRKDGVVLRITETEAYRWPHDSANHCYSGRTKRNTPMFGPAGHTYVYLCYGIHSLLNIVTNSEGEGAAVLIRACDIIEGEAKVLSRRKIKYGPALLNGPGKVGQALAVTTDWSEHSVYKRKGLEIHDAPPITNISHGPRVGIDYALPKDVAAFYRFGITGCKWVSKRNELRPV